jgi:4-amino-4-deoxy-L-arabinose transferase-like glycosyltransferase
MQKIKSVILSRYFWLVTLVIFSVSRIATWLFPYDSDHWIFYYIGRRWFDGATLYVDVWDHKSPLIYAYNGLLHSIFGANIVWHRIVFTIVALLGVWLFYKTAKLLYVSIKLKQPEWTARISTLVFAFFANLSEFTNSGNNNENLGLVFLLATLYFYLLYRKSPDKKQGSLLFSGITAGFVFLLKANFAVFLLPIVIDLILLQRKNIYKLISSLAFFAFGTLAQLLAWALYFVHVGTFKQSYTATFVFNSKYIRALGFDLNAPGIAIFLGILALLLLFFAPFLLKALWGFKKKDQNLGFFVPIMAICLLLFLVMAGTFYSHYFLIAIPYLCLIAGAKAAEVLKNYRVIKLLTFALIATILFMVSLKQLYNTFNGSVAVDARNQKAVASYIKDHTKPSDTFFAYTYGATFYQLADRNSGSRFISASHPLIDYKYHFGYDFNRTFILDMEELQAKYVVMSSDPTDIYRTENPVLMRYFEHNYKLETELNDYDILVRINN